MTNYDFDIGLDELREEHDRLNNPQANKSNIFFKPGEGVTVMRILPRAPGKKLYCATRLHPLGKHYHCLRTLQDGKWRGHCPVCDEYWNFYELAKKSKTEDDAKTLRAIGKSIKPYERYYYNVLVRKVFDPQSQETLTNVGPLVASFGEKLHAIILREIFGDPKAEEPGRGNVTHPSTGRDFKYVKITTKSPEGTFPNYDQSKFLDISLLGTPTQVETWMGGLHDLQALRDTQLKTPAELQDQLDIFLKRKPDPNAGKEESFNYGANTRSSAPTQSVTSRQVDVPEQAPFDDDMGIVEDDFIRELKQSIGTI